jgi:hypothetical protein
VRMLSSPRFRRRLLHVGAPLLGLGVLALVIALWGNTGKEEYRNATPVQRGTSAPPPPAPKTIPLTAKRRDDALATARKFLQTAVAREHVAESWPIVHPKLRQGLTRKEWASGSIPIVPYPVEVARWRLGYSNEEAVGFEVLLLPSAGKGIQPQVFDIELIELGAGKGRHWTVSSWAPRSAGIFQRPPPSPERSAAEAKAVAESEKNAIAAGWLLAPIGLIVGTLLVVPVFLVAREWRGRRRAERSYREHRAALERDLPVE